MRMEQVEQVLAIAAAGSINKAAQELFISQPNLSLSLRQLEAELGAAIFLRTARGVELTQFGREFLTYAQPAYKQFRLLRDFCAAQTEQPPLTLNIASQYLRFANTVFTSFCQEHAGSIDFSFIEGPFNSIVDMVRSQEAEIGLVVLSKLQKSMILHLLRTKGLEYHHLCDQRLMVIVGPNNPLYAQAVGEVRVEQLAERPIVFYRDVHHSFAAEWDALKLGNAHRKITVADRATLHEIIANTDAYMVCVHNESAYRNTGYYSNMRALPLADRQTRLEIGWITNRSRPLSPVAGAYISRVSAIIADDGCAGK